MKPIPNTAKMVDVARRIVWFEPPEQPLADPIRFMAYAMTYAHYDDMRLIRRYVSDDEIREALDRAPAGIMDSRSWAYWNSKIGRYPAPPPPVRRFPNAGEAGEFVPEQASDNGDLAPKAVTTADGQRAEARVAWQKMRQQQPSTHDLEETRRRAREDWLAKYGRTEKP